MNDLHPLLVCPNPNSNHPDTAWRVQFASKPAGQGIANLYPTQEAAEHAAQQLLKDNP